MLSTFAVMPVASWMFREMFAVSTGTCKHLELSATANLNFIYTRGKKIEKSFLEILDSYSRFRNSGYIHAAYAEPYLVAP